MSPETTSIVECYAGLWCVTWISPWYSSCVPSARRWKDDFPPSTTSSIPVSRFTAEMTNRCRVLIKQLQRNRVRKLNECIVSRVGFMTTLELELYQSVPSAEFNTYWIPCTWFVNLLKEARKNHRLSDAQGLKLIMEVRVNFPLLCFFSHYLRSRSFLSKHRHLLISRNFFNYCLYRRRKNIQSFSE